MQILEIGTASETLHGQTESGDRSLVEPFPGGVLMAVIDGLGHGAQAAEVAETTVDELRAHPSDSLIQLVRRCHDKLRGTRGVVLSLASFRVRDSSMSWISVGNVEGVFLHNGREAKRHQVNLILRGGVVGSNLPILQAAAIPVSGDDMVVFASDGVRNDFSQDPELRGEPQELADYILARYAKKSDDALVLVARYRGES